MPILIRDTLLRDPSKEGLVNNGQARITNESADDNVTKELRGELSTFVCEGQYAEGIITILSSFLGSRSQTHQKAAWVSGFFGSGKSHLLKMLCHLWSDTKFPDGATARSLVAELPEEVRDLLRELDVAGKRSGGLLAAAGTLPAGTTENVRLSVLSILLRACGLPTQYPQAQFHLWLEERGILAKVKGAVEAAGKKWAQELNNLYVSPLITRALLACDSNFATSEASAKEIIKAQFPNRTTDLTTEEFLTMFKRVLLRAGKDGQMPCTILILDEAQQYIGDSETRSVLITEIAEAVSKQLDSQVILVAAGQSALTGVKLLNKLLDRFTIRIQLSDADVETVTRKVLLRKQPTSLTPIAELLDTHAGEVSRQLQGTKIGERLEDKAIIVEDYPLLPVRRRFWEHCFRQVDTAGTQSQLRSQLRIIHDCVAKLTSESLGRLIPGDDLYEALAPEMVTTGALPREINERIVTLGRDGTKEGRLQQRICGLVFLIGQLPTDGAADIGVRATKEHLADLLVDDLAADNGKLRAEVARLLDKLADEGVLMRVGTEFRIQTEEGRNWDSEFRQRESKLKNDVAFFDERRDQLLAADVQKTVDKVKVLHGAAKVPRDLKVHRSQDVPQSDGESIQVWLRDGFSTSEKEILNAARAVGVNSATLFVFIPRKSRDELLNLIATEHAAEQTLNAKGAPATPEGQVARQSMESRYRLAKQQRETLVSEIVAGTKVFQGGGNELLQLSLDEKLRAGADASLARLFPRFKEADFSGSAWESAMKRARDGADQPFSPLKYEGPIEQHPVCRQVLSAIGSGKTGTQLRKELESSPFGWPRDAVDAALIALHRSQHVTATLNGVAVGVGQLDQNKVPKTEFRVEKITLSIQDRNALRALYQEVDVKAKGDELDAKAPEFFAALLTLAS
ncbi:MAG: BREX system P-loop protein BrxC, partial [Bryobacterales bacterium]|nr:BREX system P-loop protein BrxC [Bryobacterales bacterium]